MYETNSSLTFGSRRKKTRCGGERPVCSYCARLGQECQYDGVTSEQQVSELLAGLDAGVLLNRISTLESKLKRLGMDGDGGYVIPKHPRIASLTVMKCSHSNGNSIRASPSATFEHH